MIAQCVYHFTFVAICDLFIIKYKVVKTKKKQCN